MIANQAIISPTLITNDRKRNNNTDTHLVKFEKVTTHINALHPLS